MDRSGYIQTAKKIETDGLEFYQNALEKVQEPNSEGLLRFLIEEEKMHLEYFQALEQGTPGKIEKHEHPLFKKEDYQKMGSNRSEVIGVFNTALEMEEKGIKFYREAAKQTDDEELKKFLLELAEMEKTHFKMIKEHQEAIYNYWYWEAIEEPRMET